jgi:tRNA (guanine-N(7)-)-methyltransferase subunit TRM82
MARLQCFSPEADGQWFPDHNMGGVLKWFSLRVDDADSAASDSNANNAKSVKDILYGIENLRKRPGGDDQE